jgi:hypothetical protein
MAGHRGKGRAGNGPPIGRFMIYLCVIVVGLAMIQFALGIR